MSFCALPYHLPVQALMVKLGNLPAGDALGPFVLVDKSFLESLNPEEAKALHRHYCAFLCPILLREILGNLAKTDFTPDEALARVIGLAAKADGSAHMLCTMLAQ